MCAFGRQGQIEPGAGLQSGDDDDAEHQRDHRGAEEPSDGARADAAELRAGAHVRNAGDQRSEHQRCDDHLDEAQEDIGDDAEVRCDARGLIGSQQSMADPADEYAGDHPDQDDQREAVRHQREPRPCQYGSRTTRRWILPEGSRGRSFE